MRSLSYLLVLFLVCTVSCKNCKDSDCLNNGYCGDSGCECTGNYTGKNCEINSCENIDCNHGACVNGLCDCSPGYDGTDCNEEVHTKFIGDYLYTSPCVSGSKVSIIRKIGPTSSSEIVIQSVYDPNAYVHALYAKVSETSITVASQNLPNGSIASGSGSISGGVVTLNMSYKPTASSTASTCKYTFVKQ
jgi:hypothetical protein